MTEILNFFWVESGVAWMWRGKGNPSRRGSQEGLKIIM